MRGARLSVLSSAVVESLAAGSRAVSPAAIESHVALARTRAAHAAGAGGATVACPGGTAGPAGAELGAELGTGDTEVGNAAAAVVAPAADAGRAAAAESSRAAVATKVVNAGDRQAPRACLGTQTPPTPMPSESASRLGGGAAAEAKASPMPKPPAYAERTAPKQPVPTSLEGGATEWKPSSMPEPVLGASLDTKPRGAAGA